MFEAYAVGIKLTLINQVTPALGLISSHLMKTGKDVDALKGKLKEIKLLGLTGAAIGGAGFMGLGLISKTIKPATEYAHQLAQMNVSGMKQLEITKAIHAAWAANKEVPTSSVVENLSAIRDLRMVFGNTAHAIEFMPAVQKTQAILQSVRHMEGGSAKSEAYEMAKALEMKGAVKSPDQFMSQADMMTRAMVAMGSKVGASDFLQAFKYGRSATAGWNEDFTYKILPTLIQEMKTSGGGGGSTGGPGTALMSAYSAIVGGTVTQKALKLWGQLGLVDMSKAEWTKVGELKGIRPGGIKGSEEFQSNPFEWTKKYLMPALQAHGYTTEAQQRGALQYLFPNRTSGFIMTQMAMQPWKFDRDKNLIEQAQGLSAYNALLKTDPVMAYAALHKSMENLKAAIGISLVPILIPALKSLTDGLNSFAVWSRAHPNLTKSLVVGFTALSAAMAISGTIMVLTGGFKALRLGLSIVGAAQGVGSIGSLNALLGKGGLVLAAGAAGYAIGNLINRLLGIENGELGSWVWDKTHNSDGQSKGWWKWAKQSANMMNPFRASALYQDNEGPSPYVASGRRGVPGHSHDIVMDGRKVATGITKHQAAAAGSPQKGINAFDMSMGLAYPGY